MSAFLTSLASVGNQFGEAKNAQNDENFERQQKLKSMDVQDAYLQIAKQAEARQQASTDQAIKAGRFHKIGNRYWDVEKNGWADLQGPDPMQNLKSFIGKQKKEVGDQLYSEAETLSSSGMAPEEVIKKVLEDARSINTQIATREAADERAKLSREATDKRAKEGREAAAKRQQASFGEREKLSHDVTKAQGDALDADARISRMNNDLQNAEKSPDGAGAFDMDLLAQHVALTFGAIKGGIRSKAMIDEHANAISLLEKAKRAIQSGVRGAQLSPQQRRNFLILGKEAQQAAHDKYNAIKMSIQGVGESGSPNQQEQMLPGEEIETE